MEFVWAIIPNQELEVRNKKGRQYIRDSTQSRQRLRSTESDRESAILYNGRVFLGQTPKRILDEALQDEIEDILKLYSGRKRQKENGAY